MCPVLMSAEDNLSTLFFSLQSAQGFEGSPSSSCKRIIFFISMFAFIVLQVVFCCAARLLLHILHHEACKHQKIALYSGRLLQLGFHEGVVLMGVCLCGLFCVFLIDNNMLNKNFLLPLKASTISGVSFVSGCCSFICSLCFMMFLESEVCTCVFPEAT